jgi:hypothetical protein
MAFAINDRVKETSTTTGTGTLNLGGAVSGFQTFVAGIGDGNTTYYAIVNETGTEFEVGIGTVTDSGTDTLSRDTILESSNSDSAVSFSSGTKTVFCTLPAEKAVVTPGSGDMTLSAPGNFTVDATTDIILDADGGDVFFKDGGTTIATLSNTSSDFVITTGVQDKDFIIKGDDGGSGITALTIDMSAAGAVTFNDKITAVGTSVFTNLDISGDVDVDGTLETDALSIASTAVTSTAAELNILDGVTADATELNLLDGVTATTAEINYSDTGASVGTVVASKVVTVDSNKDVASFRNITLTGELDAGSLDVSGDADIDGTLEADAITIGGTAINTVIAGVTVTNATNAAHVSVADNESTDENNLIPFIEDTSATGNVGLESDGDFTYNPSTGRLTATQLAGTLQTAAQANITSLGTLTTLTVDNVIINGSTIGHTGDTDLMTVASGILTVAGEVSMTTLDIGGTNVTATAAELNHTDGVTSNIQTQLDSKATPGFAVAMAIAL